jgi:hypothetical protein
MTIARSGWYVKKVMYSKSSTAVNLITRVPE